MNRTCFLFVLLIVFTVANVSAQTQKDTIYTYFSKTPVVVDGSDADGCWSKAEWHAIDQVWIPYNAKINSSDFTGRYKAAWDTDYLYLLVEITDDMLSDDHSNPLQNWWDDDCVELFIDEDRSKGDHEKNNNAFAYHVSTKYDAIDQNSSGGGVNYKSNLAVVMDTIDTNLYMWEFAIKMYNKNFTTSNPEASRVKLTPNKLMGFSIAYCDNDQGTARENFIGSMIMTSATANDNYKTANYFGSMLLVDPNGEWVSVKDIQKKRFSVYPNPASNNLTISNAKNAQLEICTSNGRIVRTEQLIDEKETIEIGDLPKGLYLLKLSDKNGTQYELIMKQ